MLDRLILYMIVLGTSFWEYLERIDSLLEVVTFLLGLAVWLRKKNQNREVQLFSGTLTEQICV
jgi:hypothetical protein